MCNKTHNYTVENEARREVRYIGTDETDAIAWLVTLLDDGDCGHVTAEHETETPDSNGPGSAYCSAESARIDDEAIATRDYMGPRLQVTYMAFEKGLPGTTVPPGRADYTGNCAYGEYLRNLGLN